MRNPKKKSEKKELGKEKCYNQMGQVGTSWSRGTSGTRRRGSSDLVGQVEQGEGGLQIFVGQVGQGQGVCPLEPFYSSQMGLQDRGMFITYRHHVYDLGLYKFVENFHVFPTS